MPARAYLEALEARLGQELADKIMAEVLKTLKCDSTKEVLALVDSIIELLPSSEDKPEPEPEKGNDEGADESGDNGESEADPEGEGEGETGNTDSDGTGEEGSDPSGEQNSSQGDGAGGDQPANGGEDGTGSGQPNSEQKSSPEGQGESSDQKDSRQRDATLQPGDGQGAPLGLRERVMQATEKDLQGLISEVGDAAAELLGRKAAAHFTPIKPFPLGGRAVRRSAEASYRRRISGEAHSAGLRQILNGLLQAQVDCRVRLKRQGRRIDNRASWRCSGSGRIWCSPAWRNSNGTGYMACSD